MRRKRHKCPRNQDSGHVRARRAREAGLRLFTRRTKPLRGGKDPGLVHKPLASATRPIASDFVPCLYQRAASCYSPAWFCLGRVWPLFFHFAVVEHSTQNTPFAHLFNLLLKAKAVPVAASSSAFVSAGPTGPELRPRSSTALRIQDSSEGELYRMGRGFTPIMERSSRAISSGSKHLPPLTLQISGGGGGSRALKTRPWPPKYVGGRGRGLLAPAGPERQTQRPKPIFPGDRVGPCSIRKVGVSSYDPIRPLTAD